MSGVTLAPCARVGGATDWWQEQHRFCTGSQHVEGTETRCVCACHAVTGVTIGRSSAPTIFEVMPLLPFNGDLMVAELRAYFAAIKAAKTDEDYERAERAARPLLGMLYVQTGRAIALEGKCV